MPTPAKKPAAPTTGQPAPQANEPAQKSAPPAAPHPAKPFLRFYHPSALRTSTLTVLTTVEQAEDSTRHRNALSDVVLELTDHGLDYYFLAPLTVAKVGFVAEQSARMGMSGVKRMMAPVIRNVIGHMDKHQLISICTHIRQLME